MRVWLITTLVAVVVACVPVAAESGELTDLPRPPDEVPTPIPTIVPATVVTQIVDAAFLAKWLDRDVKRLQAERSALLKEIATLSIVLDALREQMPELRDEQ